MDSKKYQILLADRLHRVENSKYLNERVGQITDIITSTARECALKMKQNLNLRTVQISAQLFNDSKRAFRDWKKEDALQSLTAN